jgi:hypothetical protein
VERQKNQDVMADILFNKSGVPLIAYGKSYQATTTGTPAEKPKNHPLPDLDAGKNLRVTGKKKATTA